MSEPLTDAHLELIRRNAGLGLDACPVITGELLAEVDRLNAEVAALRSQVRGHCDRIAAQAALLSRNAERDALGRLEAWEQASVQKRVFNLSPWHALLWDTDDCQAYAYASPRDREDICLDEGVSVVIVGTDDKPATLAETIVAALDLWQKRYGEG